MVYKCTLIVKCYLGLSSDGYIGFRVLCVTFDPSPQCIATIFILCIGETHNLINYVSFINYLSYGVTIAALLYLRWKKPNIMRPIKVNSTSLYVSVLSNPYRSNDLSLYCITPSCSLMTCLCTV